MLTPRFQCNQCGKLYHYFGWVLQHLKEKHQGYGNLHLMSPIKALEQFKEFVRIFGEDGEGCIHSGTTRQALRVLESLVEEIAALKRQERCV